MSKHMTPCEKLGYKVGDKFKVVDGTGVHYAVGSFITLIHDDGSSCPRFNGVHSIFESGDCFFPIDFVEKVAKLKPAKQALADAIHQSGGWADGAEWCAISSADMKGSFWNAKESWLSRENGIWCGYGYMHGRCFSVDRLPVNHHQTTLSRDEYFTAYPEQVKVEVNNETEHNVEVEMKSESEVTIKVSDWHKNGELPPVGEVCIFDPSGRTEFFDEKAINAIGKEVSIISHVKFNGAVGSVAVFMCDTGGVATVCTANQDCFRPLRTEREKAIDEMVGEFINYYGDPKGGERYLGIAEKLYDAGYRKEVK